MHVLRHSLGMDLLQQGVDRSVIALWLGHESRTTPGKSHGDTATENVGVNSKHERDGVTKTGPSERTKTQRQSSHPYEP
jgi:hypothetical protein